MNHIHVLLQNTMKIGIIVKIHANSSTAEQEGKGKGLQSSYLLCHFSIIPLAKQSSQESLKSSNYTKYNHT